MSENQKAEAWTAARVSASVAVITLLVVMSKGVWTVAGDWGSFSTRVLSIDTQLQQHIQQTKEFQKSVDDRLKRLENRLGFGIENAWR